MPQLFLNNFQTQFIATVKAAPESSSPALELDYGVLRVSDGAAGLLLNPTAGNWYVLTAFKRSGSAESDYEVLHVTAVDNAVLGECRLTVLRGQEGTTPKSYVAGDIVELRLTAGGMGQYVQTTDARMSNSRAPAGAAGGVLSGAYPNPGFAQAMATAAELSGKVDKVGGKGLSANDYTNADLAKLAGIAELSTKNSTDAQLRDRASHTGAQAIATVTGLQTALDAKALNSHTHAGATNAAAGFMSAADKAKLDGIAASATVNATDEALRARASHTGTQTIATIEGLQLALGDKVDVVAGKGLSSADFTTAEKAKLGGIAASATANASDAELRARASHTGTQAVSTVEGLAAALAGKQPNLVSGTNIKTINGQDVTGSGDIAIAGSAAKSLKFYTTNNSTYTASKEETLLFYIGGKGGNGGRPPSTSSGGCSGGGGGGFAYGNLELMPGDAVLIDFTTAANTVRIRVNGDVVAIANNGGNGAFASNGVVAGAAGGTASITAAVLDGGAFSGGAGGGVAGTSSSRGAGGGGSCGSPLGNGFSGGSSTGNGVAGSGGGIGGVGLSNAAGIGGGGGAGEAGTATYGGGSTNDGSTRGLLTSFQDPLLKHAFGPRGSMPFPGVGGFGGPGGDFGGGGTTTVISGYGGLMGGGAGQASSIVNNGGAGGYGGGGGGGFSSSQPAAPGGAAFCFLYY